MISVIIPVYNSEKYLDKSISSVLNQTYENFELLLIDDGSTDSSYEICKKWSETDCRIKVFSQKNAGPGSARNLGLDMSKGNYIFFLDSDDYILPTCFEKLINQMTDDIDVVACDYHDVSEDGKIFPKPSTYTYESGIRLTEDAIYDLFAVRIYARVVWGKLYKRYLWDDIRFNDLSYSEDTHALFQIFEKVKKIYLVDEILYFYVHIPGSISHQFDLNKYNDLLQTLFYLHTKAIEKYPACKQYSGQKYLANAYYLLKKYQQLKMKPEALDLIEKMQFVRNTSLKESKRLSHKLLVLPKYLVYLLIIIKNMIVKEPDVALNSTI